MKSMQQLETEIIKNMLKDVPIDYLIQQGIPAIYHDDHIHIRSVYGLSMFLQAWIDENLEGANLMARDLIKLFKNYGKYLEYSERILKFINNKGRLPEKDEAWDLEIPIDEMDFVLELLNIRINGEIFHKLNIEEKKYFDELSKSIILSEDKTDEFKLEHLSAEHGLNLIDAKIIPLFMNDLLNIENLDEEIIKYFNLSKLTEREIGEFNDLATKIIKLQFLKKDSISLLDLARSLETTIMKASETLHFLNNSDQVMKFEFSDDDIKVFSKHLSQALQYCHAENTELSANLLISQFNLDYISANKALVLFSKKFTLPTELSRQELKKFDNISHLLSKYIKDINNSPTIEDLMINLDLNIKNANLIFSFINRISSEPFNEDFNNYPEKTLLDIDDLSCQILKSGVRDKKEQNLIDLAYQFNSGVYSIQRAISYISWIEKKIDKDHVIDLEPKKRAVIEDKIVAALKFIKKNDLSLDFEVLIKEVGFNLKDTHLIIRTYNEIITKDVNVDNLSDAKKQGIEGLARKIYKEKKNGKISSYEPEEVFTLKIKKTSLEELWEAIVYLKLKVLNVLMSKSRVVKLTLGKITSEGEIQLKERHGTKIGKKEEIKLSKESINLQDTKIKFKTTSDKVELKRGIDFVGGLIRYKVAIKNNTEMIINNLDVSLQMTAEHVRTIDIKPRVYRRGDRARIPSMSPGQSESIDFYLEPMICGSIPVSPALMYADAFGNTQLVSKEKLFLDSKCPPIINPGEENIAKVKSIYESKDTIRSFRSFELKHEPSKIFNLLREAIGSWAGKPVTKPIFKSKNPFIAEVYYYVLNQNEDPDLGHREQIIVKIGVMEENNVVILNIGAEKNPTVNGVLTHIWQLANNRIGDAFGYEFESLHCPECGGSLENMTKSKKFILCKYCGEKFEKKAL